MNRYFVWFLLLTLWLPTVVAWIVFASLFRLMFEVAGFFGIAGEEWYWLGISADKRPRSEN